MSRTGRKFAASLLTIGFICVTGQHAAIGDLSAGGGAGATTGHPRPRVDGATPAVTLEFCTGIGKMLGCDQVLSVSENDARTVTVRDGCPDFCAAWVPEPEPEEPNEHETKCEEALETVQCSKEHGEKCLACANRTKKILWDSDECDVEDWDKSVEKICGEEPEEDEACGEALEATKCHDDIGTEECMPCTEDLKHGLIEDKNCTEAEWDDDVEEFCEVEEDLEASAKFSNTVTLLIVALILLTIAFETLKDLAKENAGEEMEEIVNSLLGELTILGFIGLSSFLCVKAGLSTKISVAIFCGEEDHEADDEHGDCIAGGEKANLLTETLENMHMTIFGVMCVYVGQVLLLMTLGHRNISLWEYCEEHLEDVIKEERAKCLEVRNADASAKAAKAAQFEPHQEELKRDYYQNLSKKACIDLTPVHVNTFGRSRFLLRYDYLKINFVRKAYDRHKVPKNNKAAWVGPIPREGAKDTDGTFVHGWKELVDTVYGEGHGIQYRDLWVPAAYEKFDFAGYLKRSQQHIMEEIVEVSISTWTVVLLMCILLRVVLLVDVELRIIISIIYGYALCFAMFVVKKKVSQVLDNTTPNWPPPERNSPVSAGAGGLNESLLSVQGSTITNPTGGARDTQLVVTIAEHLPIHPVVVAPPSFNQMGGLQRARSNFMGVPIEAKEKLKKQHMLWWRCGCHADHHKRKEDPTEEHGSSMFLGIISAILLLNAIYVGTFIFWILAGSGYPLVKHFEPEESSSLPVWWEPLVLSIVALLPPFITMFVLTPRALLDFIMVTCLEEYISKSRIQEVLHDGKIKLVKKLFDTIEHVHRMSSITDALSSPETMRKKLVANAQDWSHLQPHVRDYLDFLHGVEEKDVTKNYQINQHDFDHMISHLPGFSPSKETLSALFAVMNMDGDEFVSMEEFMNFAQTFLAAKDIHEEVEELFAMIDSSGGENDDGAEESDGMIQREEFKDFMVTHTQYLPGNEITADDIDEILDGVYEGKGPEGINDEQFLAFMMSMSE